MLYIWISLVTIIVWIYFYKKQTRFNETYPLLSSKKYFFIKYMFLILSILVLGLSIFDIKSGNIISKNINKGIDIMFVLDVSKSMNVADFQDNNYNYTRLDIAKKSILDFVGKHQDDRFGLIIFSQDAISTIPLTTDHNVFMTSLLGVDYKNLTKQGTNFDKAIELGINRFVNSKNEDRWKAIVLFSDWWDEDTTINQSYLKQLFQKQKDIKFFVVWIWTKQWWRIILWQDPFWRIKYQKYKWQYVISKLNERQLKEISNLTNGKYFRLNDTWDLSKLDKDLEKLNKKISIWSTNIEKNDATRLISIYSLILFVIYLLYYTFEDNFYKKISIEKK